MTVRSRTKHPTFVVAVLLSLSRLISLGALSGPRAAGGQKEAIKKPIVTLNSRRPIIAVWRDNDGYPAGGAPPSEAPYLRVAIWEGGRVLSAEDPGKWNHELREGKISAKQVAALKKQITRTPVFRLEETFDVAMHAPEDCVLVSVGEKRRLLTWTERKSATYGVGVYAREIYTEFNPPSRVEFKTCWITLNQLALASRPKNSSPVKGRFGDTPRSGM